MVVGVIITVITVLFTSFVLYYKWSFTYWKRRNVFALEPSIPFGNFKKMLLRQATLGDEFHKVYNSIKSRGLRYGGLYIFAKPLLLVVDLELIKNVLAKDFQHFTDHANYVNEEADPLSGHLVRLKGPKWKAVRTKLTPAFTSGKLKMMFDTIVDCTKYLPDIIDGFIATNEPIDIKEIFERYTVDVIGSVGFGIDCNCLKNPEAEFRKYGKKAFEAGSLMQSIKNLLSMINPELLMLFNATIIDKEVREFFMNIVKKTIEYRENNNVDRKDFMKLLIELKNQKFAVESVDSESNSNGEVAFSQDGLSLNEICAQAYVFFVAGFETTSTTLTFCMLELASNLDIQEKVRKEVKEVLEKYNGKITYDAINEMTYLEKCVQETLRKYPPAAAIGRSCTKTYPVPDSDLVLPQGSLVFISVYGVHHDPEYYPEPEKFDPERFSEENKSKRHPFTYLPFGEGPRICIGLRFGILEVKVAISSLLRKYKFTLNTKTKTPIEFDPKHMVPAVKGGVWLNAENA